MQCKAHLKADKGWWKDASSMPSGPSTYKANQSMQLSDLLVNLSRPDAQAHINFGMIRLPTGTWAGVIATFGVLGFAANLAIACTHLAFFWTQQTSESSLFLLGHLTFIQT